MNADQIILAVREGQKQVVENLYDDFMEDFLSWAGRRFSGNQEDFEDAWQDAVIVFYENVISGKLKALNCEIRTYLFAVGYKRLLKNNRKMKRIFWRDKIDDALQKDHTHIISEFDDPWEEERELLLNAMNQLSPQCQSLLVGRYFDEKKLEEIQQEFHFNTPNSTSASLSRCLNKLREIIAGMKTSSGKETPSWIQVSVFYRLNQKLGFTTVPDNAKWTKKNSNE